MRSARPSVTTRSSLVKEVLEKYLECQIKSLSLLGGNVGQHSEMLLPPPVLVLDRGNRVYNGCFYRISLLLIKTWEANVVWVSSAVDSPCCVGIFFHVIKSWLRRRILKPRIGSAATADVVVGGAEVGSPVSLCSILSLLLPIFSLQMCGCSRWVDLRLRREYLC